ncbi:MAG TPA: phosphopentomutase [Candidatus Obscuribacter sp.]|nr:phosphopentomutase [Candidatus Obscuribacter sp.]
MSQLSKHGSGRRAIVVVIDGCGIGASPDHADFGDAADCNTLANTARALGGLDLPNMAALGLGNITAIEGVKPVSASRGYFGRLAEASNGKDTQTGHWEMMGIISPTSFPMYPNGFPPEVIDRFIKETGCGGILCNKPASGTDVLEQLGEEHARTRFPIVYTSGDSVFQIACHVDVIPLAELYRWCEIARVILDGPHRVGRVIARPFAGVKGAYKRISADRRDYAVPPPAQTFLDYTLASGLGVFGVGKIEDIFVGHGLSHAKHTGTNREGLELTLQAIRDEVDMKAIEVGKSKPDRLGLIFTNLVDTDSLYGHRRDPKGYGVALKEIDQWLGQIMQSMGPDDLLLISSDHGNDPTAPGTDHTREYVPLIAYSPSLNGAAAQNAGAAHDLGIREGFADIAGTLNEWLALDWHGAGKSVLPAV